MKNVWKGLVVGALTGAGVGLVLDVLDRGAQKAGAVGEVVEDVVQHAPQVVARVRHGVTETVSRIHDADIPEQLKEAADATKRRVSAGVPEQVKEVADATRQRVSKAVAHGNEAIGSLPS